MKIISHRGNMDHPYKENTKSAIIDALNQEYIDGVEFDVRITLDKKLVVIHNMTIDRASDGYGFVSLMKLKQLKKYNFGTKENPESIATLEEVLKSIYNDKIIMIELKHETDEYEDYLTSFSKIIKKYSFLNLYICSFQYNLIKALKEKHPKFKCGLIIGPFLNSSKNTTIFDFLSYEYHLKVPETKKEIFLWTVNKKEKYNYNIITDKPSLFNFDNHLE